MRTTRSGIQLPRRAVMFLLWRHWMTKMYLQILLRSWWLIRVVQRVDLFPCFWGRRFLVKLFLRCQENFFLLQTAMVGGWGGRPPPDLPLQHRGWATNPRLCFFLKPCSIPFSHTTSLLKSCWSISSSLQLSLVARWPHPRVCDIHTSAKNNVPVRDCYEPPAVLSFGQPEFEVQEGIYCWGRGYYYWAIL